MENTYKLRRSKSTKKIQKNNNFNQILLQQFIVSSILMICILLIVLIKNDHTMNLRAQLKSVLKKTMSSQELSNTSKFIMSKYILLKDSTFKLMFEDKNKPNSDVSSPENLEYTENLDKTDSENLEYTENLDKTDRIDEDILEQINNFEQKK